jgi:hypothetical protein
MGLEESVVGSNYAGAGVWLVYIVIRRGAMR